MPYTYQYPRPALSVDIAVFRKHQDQHEILLIRRKHDPYAGMWALPGGFMEIDETLEQAAVRELAEETGLRLADLKQFHTYSNLDRDPRTRVITTVYYGFVDLENSGVAGGDDAEEAGWFPVANLPRLGFDHSDIIYMLLDQVIK